MQTIAEKILNLLITIVTEMALLWQLPHSSLETKTLQSVCFLQQCDATNEIVLRGQYVQDCNEYGKGLVLASQCHNAACIILTNTIPLPSLKVTANHLTLLQPDEMAFPDHLNSNVSSALMVVRGRMMLGIATVSVQCCNQEHLAW